MNPVSQPLVSIVLPTFNRANVLPFAIESVINQSYPNWELIVVDDSSSDNTHEVVKSFVDPRIHYFRNVHNLRLPNSLNKGFSLSQGDYLTWTSDDNLYANNAIEKMVERLQASHCDLVYADYFLFSQQDSNGAPLDPRLDRLPDNAQLEKGNHIGACFLYTRQVYETTGDYDPELFLVEDYDYFIRIAKQFRLCHLPEPLYFFRRDNETLYCSRFCEVKAADVLVRFKNGLVNEHDVVETLASILLRDPNDLVNPLLRASHSSIHKLSYRLDRYHQRFLSWYVRRRLDRNSRRILENYRAGGLNFVEAKNRLCQLLQTIAKVEYK